MTEKDYNPEQKQMKAMNKQKAANKAAAPIQKASVKKEEKKPEPSDEKKSETPEETKQEEKKKLVEKTKVAKKEHPKKEEAFIHIKDIPISTKHSMAICDFIRNKKLGLAIEQLEDVLKFKKVIPMKGEIPHRHGKGIMAGRYPIRATENFVKLLRSLAANANYNGLEEPVIVKAVANLGSRPFGKFGAVRRKRTHLEIVVKDKVKKEKPKETKVEKKEEKVEVKKETHPGVAKLEKKAEVKPEKETKKEETKEEKK